MEFPGELRRQLDAEGSVTLSIRVRPGAAVTQFRAFMDDGSVKIDLAAPPEDGRANDELVRFLSACFVVPVRQIDMLSGQTARRKLVKITA